MALNKPYLFKGKEANYWLAVDWKPSKLNGKTYVTVGLYFDSTTREVDKNAKTWNNLIQTFDFSLEGLLRTEAEVYQALNNLAFFDGAVPC